MDKAKVIKRVLWIVNDWCDIPDGGLAELIAMVCDEVENPAEREAILRNIDAFDVYYPREIEHILKKAGVIWEAQLTYSGIYTKEEAKEVAQEYYELYKESPVQWDSERYTRGEIPQGLSFEEFLEEEVYGWLWWGVRI